MNDLEDYCRWHWDIGEGNLHRCSKCTLAVKFKDEVKEYLSRRIK